MSPKKFEINADHARVPGALPVFMRRTIRPIRYSRWLKLCDWFDGRRDRGPRSNDATTGTTIPVISSPWLQRLQAECLNAVAQERSLTESLVTVIDRQIAELRGRSEEASSAVTRLEEALKAAGATSISAEASCAAEQYSTQEERQQRRRREQSQRMAALRSALDAAVESRRFSAEQIAVLEQEKLSHWTVLQQRSRVLFEHYQRRTATYTRSMERRRAGQLFRVPVLELPDWVSADLGAGRTSSLDSLVQLVH